VQGVVRMGRKSRSMAATQSSPGTTPAAQGTTRKRKASKGERIIARVWQIGEGRTGAKRATAETTKRMARLYLMGLEGGPRYTRGKKKGQERSFEDRMRNITKNITSREERDRAARIVQADFNAEARRKRAAARRIEIRADDPLNRNGLAQNTANKLKEEAARLERMEATRRFNESAAEAERRKRTKTAGATDNARKDANRLRVLNRRISYLKKKGATADDLGLRAAVDARKALVSSMIEKGGRRIRIAPPGRSTRQDARRRAERRLRQLSLKTGSDRKLYRFTTVQQQNIFGGVDRVRGRGKLIGRRTRYGVFVPRPSTYSPAPGSKAFREQVATNQQRIIDAERRKAAARGGYRPTPQVRW
jgi:hypothetical protein